MKKLFLSLAVGAMLLCGAEMKASDSTVMEKVVLYLPNRIVDAFDCFTLNLGVGPVIRGELMCTRAALVGGSYGMTTKLYKDHNRQYGVGIDTGWYWSLAFLGEENMRRDRAAGLVKSYWEAHAGFPVPTQRIYDIQEGARDYWQVGGALGALIEGEVYLHPVEGFDFVAGFFLLDFKGDDLTFDDFR